MEVQMDDPDARKMDGVNPATEERPMAGDGLTRPEGAEIAPPGGPRDKDAGKAATKDKLPPPPEGDLSM
jgi:hypothetical protein